MSLFSEKNEQAQVGDWNNYLDKFNALPLGYQGSLAGWAKALSHLKAS